MKQFSKNAITKIQAVILVVVVVVVAVAGGLAYYYYAAPPTPAAKKKITLATSVSEYGTLDPYLSWHPSLQGTHMSIFDRVFRRQMDGTLTPRLATEWSLSADGKEWIFKLREDVKFHDGTPFNASCVEYSWNRIEKPEVWPEDTPPAGPIFVGAYIGGIEVVDEYTVKLVLTEERYPIMQFLSQGWFSIVSPTAVKNLGALGFGAQPVGTGPFKLKEYVKGQKIVLERNDDFWGAKPQLEEVEWRFLVDAPARAAALMAGDVDAINDPVLDMVPLFEARPQEFKVAEVTSLANVFIGLNNQWGPFKDVRVRQALNYAVDKESIIEYVVLGYGEIMKNPIPYGVFGWKAYEPYAYDPDKAKQLLADAGYPDGFEFECIHNPGLFVKGDEVVEAVQGYLADVDVEMKIINMDYAAFYAARQKPLNETDVQAHSWGGAIGWNDGRTAVRSYRQAYWPPMGAYPYFYTNPEVESLTEIEERTYDETEREQILQQISKIIWDDAANLWLYLRIYLWCHKANIEGIYFGGVGQMFVTEETRILS